MKTVIALFSLWLAAHPSWAGDRGDLAPGPHPKLLLTAAQVDALRLRLREKPWVAKALAAVLSNADAWMERPIKLPPRGGQWWHHYTCKKCGSTLETLSAREHRCPTCRKVYTGEPYDTVILSREHSALAQACRDLGLVYQLRREPRYAAKAREILLAYARRYLRYERHTIHGENRVGGGRVGSQTLDESVWLIPMVQGCDLIHEALTPEERRQIEHGLLRPAAQTIRDHRMGIHNIQCWKNAAVGLVGLYLDDPELIDSAFHSRHGYFRQIERGVRADGSWFEGAWGYHFYTLRALEPLVAAGLNSGIAVDVPEYRAMFLAPLRQALPNLTLPGLNDSRDVDLRQCREVFEAGYQRSGEAEVLRVLHAGPRDSLQAALWGIDTLPPAPPSVEASRNSEASGIAVLQLDGGPDAVCVMMDYGPHGGGHGHPDKLSVIVYGYGKIRALDPGCIRYGAPLHGQWYRRTLSHNTVAMDGRSQRSATGTLRYFRTSPPDAPLRFAAVSATADPALPGARFRRSLALLDGGILIDVVEVESETKHTFDWTFHCRGALTSSLHGKAVKRLGTSDGYEIPREVRLARTAKRWRAVWQDEGASLALDMEAAPDTEVFTAVAPGNPATEEVPMVVARRKGEKTHFVAVMQLAARPASIPWRIETSGGLAVVVDTPNGAVTFAVESGAVSRAAR
ncbi:MAG: heparinase II/III family protein [Planctomycetes bacterium]|nr:heparinase II/III family protein [Planctomycetota bacterium]